MSKQPSGESGQMIVILALVFVGLTAMVGLATDSAIVFWNRADLAARADAAALAGGAELPSATAAYNKALQYLSLHNILPSNHTISVVVGQVRVPNDSITVEIKRPVPTTFLNIIGIGSVGVSAKATALGSSWSGDQTYPMFRGGPTRTGSQTCLSLDSGIESVRYQWGYRWELSDTENHRSTPGIYADSRIFSGHYVAYIGSNGPTKGGADSYSGVYAWDGTSGTATNLYGTAGGYNDSVGGAYANTKRTLPGAANTGGLLWFQPLDKVTDVRSSPLVTIVPGLNSDYPVVLVNGHNGKTYALDARNGNVLWQTANTNDEYNSDGAYRSSPALAQEGSNYYIYTGTSRGNVYKIDALNGSILWRSTPIPAASVNTNVPANWVTTTFLDGAGIGASNTSAHWGYTPIYGTVAVYNGVVYLADHGKDLLNSGWGGSPSGKYPPYIYAINASDGSKKWLSSTDMDWQNNGPNNRQSPTLAYVDTNYDNIPDTLRVYGAPTDGYLYAYDALTGVEVWHKYTGQLNHRSDPVFYCGVIFGGNGDESASKIGGVWALDAVYGNSIWDSVDGDGAGPDRANPEFSTNPSAYNASGVRLIPGGVKSSPALVDGIIIVGANCAAASNCNVTGNNDYGSVWALDARTGRDLGHYDTNAYSGAGPTSPPVGGTNGDVRSGVVVGGDYNVYFGSQDGGLYQLYVIKLLILIK
jgi:outer membrane protein assembly factor BamB